MEVSVSVDEIIHTCSNEKVAQAAVASIGFVFASRVKSVAELHGLSAGAFAARVVSEFGRVASEGERKTVRVAMERSDHPILHGLQAILEHRINTDSTVGRTGRPGGWARPLPEFEMQRYGGCP